jgi:predicted enzyme involved in methoxymalonyl-ACP biosynthesis
MNEPSNYAYVFRLKDNVGDAGIISVLLAKKSSFGMQLVGWVLSCRVFNRGVEWAVAQHLATWLGQRGGASVAAPFSAGPRNAMIVDVLTSIGLESGEINGNVTWFSSKRLSPPTHHITIFEK